MQEEHPKQWGLITYRPILNWTVEQVFEQHRKHGVKPNPLYQQGMKRVGSMPCIHCGKQVALIAMTKIDDIPLCSSLDGLCE